MSLKDEGHADSSGPSLRETIANASGWGGGEGARSGDEGVNDAKPNEPAAKPYGESRPLDGASSGVDASAPASKPAPAVDSKVDGQPAAAVAPTLAPPPGFKDIKAWETTPDFTKQFIKQRESNIAREYGKMKQAADFGTGAFRALEPLMQTLKQQGVHPLQAVNGVAKLVATLRGGTERERYEAFAAAAQEYGVDLRRLVEGLPTDSTSAPSAEVIELRRQVQELTQHVHGTQQEQQQQIAHTLWNHASAFMQRPEVAELLPYVLDDMASFVETRNHAGKTVDQVLEEAFDLACYSNPSIRERRQLGVQQSSLTKQAEEAKKLRNAASVASGSAPVAGGTVPTDESIRGTLDRLMVGWPG